jgi:pyrimidine-nucleoside phosphorylase
MGAGRTRADQAVDHAVGLELACHLGDHVHAGQPVARLHVHRESDAAGPADRVQRAFRIVDEASPGSAPARQVVLGRIDG